MKGNASLCCMPALMPLELPVASHQSPSHTQAVFQSSVSSPHRTRQPAPPTICAPCTFTPPPCMLVGVVFVWFCVCVSVRLVWHCLSHLTLPSTPGMC